MSVEPHRLIVPKIHSGTVIDHIPAGKGLRVLSILKAEKIRGQRIALIMNVESRKLGKKDIVKIENVRLEEDETNLISLIAPTATINIIENYEVITKRKVQLPSRIKGLIKCPNPTCITNAPNEPVKTSFILISRDPIKLQCEYCKIIIGTEGMVLVGKL